MAEETVYYTVQARDNLYAIANQYGTTVDVIKQQKGLTSNSLSIGQKLVINTSSTPSTTTDITYTIQPGDTLYGSAQKYSTTVDKIKSLNNLTSNVLSIGQKLLIP